MHLNTKAQTLHFASECEPSVSSKVLLDHMAFKPVEFS